MFPPFFGTRSVILIKKGVVALDGWNINHNAVGVRIVLICRSSKHVLHFFFAAWFPFFCHIMVVIRLCCFIIFVLIPIRIPIPSFRSHIHPHLHFRLIFTSSPRRHDHHHDDQQHQSHCHVIVRHLRPNLVMVVINQTTIETDVPKLGRTTSCFS